MARSPAFASTPRPRRGFFRPLAGGILPMPRGPRCHQPLALPFEIINS